MQEFPSYLCVFRPLFHPGRTNSSFHYSWITFMCNSGIISYARLLAWKQTKRTSDIDWERLNYEKKTYPPSRSTKAGFFAWRDCYSNGKLIKQECWHEHSLTIPDPVLEVIMEQKGSVKEDHVFNRLIVLCTRRSPIPPKRSFLIFILTGFIYSLSIALSLLFLLYSQHRGDKVRSPLESWICKGGAAKPLKHLFSFNKSSKTSVLSFFLFFF